MGRVKRTLTSDHLAKTSRYFGYNRYPDISDRKAWGSLSDELQRKLIKAGEEAVEEPWTQLLISDFTEFGKSGNRVRFEDKYFPRRRKLNNLVMAECVENKGRFIDDILDGLYLILDETTWCLPPHTSYERDGAQERVPDVTRQIIDLFQAESGAEIAYTEYLLRPVFAEISPHISIYVNERLKERIFEPYMNQFFWWMGDGIQTMCNWTPWIVQNVLICALTREKGTFSEEEIKNFLQKAAVSCDYFLDEYGDDGGCNEGAQYYTHAGLCLFGCLELIDGATKEDSSRYAEIDDDGQVIVHDPGRKTADQACYETFAGIYNEPLIRNIANFIVKMYVGGGYYVNFADCSALAGGRTAREFLFGKAVGDETLASFAAEDFRRESDKEQIISSEINLFYHVMQAFAYDEMMAYPVCNNLAEDSWFESMGLMIARDKTYTLAAKAGDNGDSHNHNDVGSFTLYKEGRPFVIDLGVGTYTKKTFSDRRYELWTMQSQFHNLPTFIDRSADDGVDKAGDLSDSQRNGRLAFELGNDPAADAHNTHIVMQKDGKKYAAKDVLCLLGNTGKEPESWPERALLEMEISGAYAEKKVKSYKRKIALNKGDTVSPVVVKDNYEGSIPAYMSIMTYEKPEVVGNGNSNAAEGLSKNSFQNADEPCVIRVGDVGTITAVKGVKSVLIREFAITDQRLMSTWKHSVYRILFEMDEHAGEYELVLK